ncbi:MAG: hypothetical protein IJ197_06250 [Bacteroidaceae bacterium]|nr:hypothetical protein [Bacteroidaceae bacterium]
MDKEKFYDVDYVFNAYRAETHPVGSADTLRHIMAQLPTDRTRLRQLKNLGELPAVTWCASFSDHRRHLASAQSSGLFCQDIDHVGPARQYYQQHFAGREDELDILLAHISPGGEGLHVVALCQPQFSTIAQNQAWLAGETGTTYDAQCHDLSRMFYLSTAEDILFNDLF